MLYSWSTRDILVPKYMMIIYNTVLRTTHACEVQQYSFVIFPPRKKPAAQRISGACLAVRISENFEHTRRATRRTARERALRVHHAGTTAVLLKKYTSYDVYAWGHGVCCGGNQAGKFDGMAASGFILQQKSGTQLFDWSILKDRCSKEWG